MVFQSVYGVDMGTDTIKLYNHRTSSFHSEKNRIAVRGRDRVFAIGDEAWQMVGMTPEDIEILSPMSDGRINDMLMMEAVLHTLLSRSGGRIGRRPTLYFSVPMDMTEIERRAYSSIAHRGRLRHARIYLVEKPIADALAIGLPIHHTKGSMIVNIGAESTELSILADGHVIISRLIPLGGMHLNDAIVAGVRRKNNLIISMRSAQRLKLTLTDLERDLSEGRQVMGIDTGSGLPRDGIISAYTVTSAIQSQLTELAGELRRFLERIPPQVRASIHSDGIFLTGGSSRIPGLEGYFSRLMETGVRISDHYEQSTVIGLKKIICHPELQHWAMLPKKRNL